MFYSISTKDFQSKKGDFNIITVKNDKIYINSDKEIEDSDFEEYKFIESSIKELDIVDEQLIKIAKYNQLQKDREDKIKAMEDAKEEKKKELERLRSEASTLSVKYNDKTISATEDDQILLTKLMTILGNKDKTAKTQYICEDNTIVEFNLVQLADISEIIQKQTTEAYIKCRLLKDKVNTANTIEEIKSINW